MLPDFHGNRSPRADASLTGIWTGLTLDASIDDLAIRYLACLQVCTVTIYIPLLSIYAAMMIGHHLWYIAYNNDFTWRCTHHNDISNWWFLTQCIILTTMCWSVTQHSVVLPVSVSVPVHVYPCLHLCYIYTSIYRCHRLYGSITT
jgi:hypothetical protein